MKQYVQLTPEQRYQISALKGTNENTNGLIRQFLPKSARLDNLEDELVQAIEDNLNNRPRKVLGFQTPFEVKSSFGCVALHS